MSSRVQHPCASDQLFSSLLRSHHPQRVSYAELLETNPRRAVEKAVKGMLPRNKLARKQLLKLKVYAGPEHPHHAQAPKPFEIKR